MLPLRASLDTVANVRVAFGLNDADGKGVRSAWRWDVCARQNGVSEGVVL